MIARGDVRLDLVLSIHVTVPYVKTILYVMLGDRSMGLLSAKIRQKEVMNLKNSRLFYDRRSAGG